MHRATLKDVADMAGVSKATVSYILNGAKKTISPETRERVLKAIDTLGYIPNSAAASLSNNCSKLIGVVIPQTEPGSELMFENSFYSEILGAIEFEARKKGYHIIISATDVNEQYMRLVVERNLDGVIVIGMFPDEFYQQFKKIEVPVVLIDSYCTDKYFHNIRIDDEEGGYLVTKYAIEKGHKKIGFLTGQLHENGVIQKRLGGYKRALSESSIPYDEKIVFEGNVDYESGRKAASRIVDEKIDLTCLVTSADVLAIGAIKGFFDKGAKVPEKYSVMGFDDLEIASYITPGITTVRQDISQKGSLATQILFESMTNPNMDSQDVVLPFSIVERESVKRI